MKIAWFSPLPPQKSGIASYSKAIVCELKKYAEVHLWVNDVIDKEFFREFRVINYKLHPEYKHWLNDYGVIIFNMGNNVVFHLDIFEVLKEHSGLVILHDYILHHFFAGYWLDEKRDPLGYIKEMELNYGDEGKRLAQRIVAGKKKPVWETYEVINFPLNLSILKASEGIIVHSEFVKKKIEPLVEIPIKKLNHPSSDVALKSHSPTTHNNDRFILFSLGEINFNRQIDKVIKTLANDSTLKKKFLLIIVGKDTSPYALQIKKQIEVSDLMGTVSFLGYQSEEKINKLLETADLCLGLRYPSMGETSGAVIRYLTAGKPVLVSKGGWYDELPENIVIKINPGKEIEEITSILHNFLKEPEKYKAIGEKAKEFIKKNFSLDDFVQGLLEFISFVNKRKALDSLIDKVSSELISMNLTEDQTMLDKLSEELYSMFG